MLRHTWASLSVILLAVSSNYCESLENKSNKLANRNTRDDIAGSPVSPTSTGIRDLGSFVKRDAPLNGIMNLLSVPRMILSTVEFVNRISDVISGGSSPFGDLDFVSDIDRAALALHQEFTRRFDQLEARVQGIQDTVEELRRGIPILLRSSQEALTLRSYTRKINSYYMRFALLREHVDEVQNYTWLDFAKNAVAFDDNSILNTLINIHGMVAPGYPFSVRLSLST
ncbi:uncharacterized protein LOC125177542 [Hyalella azteca]|uniref:Uncharacterized protein LOC125177542 n=1 Tax=Hyalella azteca TaxID=294128 RepID=A0A8B7N7D4_HYAAZ|nr:uncharacterized protein LOC125177542 [Hyalella azteca]